MCRRRDIVAGAINTMQSGPKEEISKALSFGGNSMALATICDVPAARWVESTTCHFFLRELWVASGMSRREAGAELVFGAVSRISQSVATTTLFRTAAFAALCRHNDQAVWAFLEERSAKQPEVVDLCVIGWLIWGNKYYPFVPPQDEHAFNPYNLESRENAAVALPKVDKKKWRTLVSGVNPLYRWLAVERIAVWASDDEIQSVLGAAMQDEYYITRLFALGLLDRLASPEVQIAVVEEYLKKRLPLDKTGIDKIQREQNEQFDHVVQDTLRNAHRRLEKNGKATSGASGLGAQTGQP